LAAGLHRNSAPVAVFTGDQKDAIELGLIDDVQSVRHGEEPHTARRITSRVWIIESISRLPVFVHGTRPILAWNFIECRIRRQARTPAADDITLHHIPETLLPRSRIEIHAAIRPVWSRSGRRTSCRAAAATLSARLGGRQSRQ